MKQPMNLIMVFAGLGIGLNSRGATQGSGPLKAQISFTPCEYFIQFAANRCDPAKTNQSMDALSSVIPGRPSTPWESHKNINGVSASINEVLTAWSNQGVPDAQNCLESLQTSAAAAEHSLKDANAQAMKGVTAIGNARVDVSGQSENITPAQQKILDAAKKLSGASSGYALCAEVAGDALNELSVQKYGQRTVQDWITGCYTKAQNAEQNFPANQPNTDADYKAVDGYMSSFGQDVGLAKDLAAQLQALVQECNANAASSNSLSQNTKGIGQNQFQQLKTNDTPSAENNAAPVAGTAPASSEAPSPANVNLLPEVPTAAPAPSADTQTTPPITLDFDPSKQSAFGPDERGP